jgi:hypothetical protein
MPCSLKAQTLLPLCRLGTAILCVDLPLFNHLIGNELSEGVKMISGEGLGDTCLTEQFQTPFRGKAVIVWPRGRPLGSPSDGELFSLDDASKKFQICYFNI